MNSRHRVTCSQSRSHRRHWWHILHMYIHTQGIYNDCDDNNDNDDNDNDNDNDNDGHDGHDGHDAGDTSGDYTCIHTNMCNMER